MNPKLPQAYFQLSLIAKQQENYAEEIRFLKKAIALDPSKEDYHYRLAFAYRESGDEAKFREELNEFQKLHAATPDGHKSCVVLRRWTSGALSSVILFGIFQADPLVGIQAQQLARQSASTASPGIIQKEPHPAKPAAGAEIHFDNILEGSTISFYLRNSVSAKRYSIETMGGGRRSLRLQQRWLTGYLLHQRCRGFRLSKKQARNTITASTATMETAPLPTSPQRPACKELATLWGASAGDYDNDGFVDLYVAGVNRNQLLHNNGDGSLPTSPRRPASLAQLRTTERSGPVTAGWFDYNNDGLLDLFVVNYLDYNINTAPQCHFEAITIYCSPNDFRGMPNILYRNNGDGTFTDVSGPSHISRYAGKGMGVAFADYDNDGLTDIFVSNDTFPNYLLHNNGDGTFIDVAMVSGVAYTDNGKAVAGMGADFRDLDNDGKPDIFHTAMFGDTFPLYQKSGQRTV